MTWDEFKGPMALLQKQWTGFYSEPRIEVIFGWVEKLPADWWAKRVRYYLGHFTKTKEGPLAEIESDAQREKEALWAKHKAGAHTQAKKAAAALTDEGPGGPPPAVKEKLRLIFGGRTADGTEAPAFDEEARLEELRRQARELAAAETQNAENVEGE
jgi:hypothetical protein